MLEIFDRLGGLIDGILISLGVERQLVLGIGKVALGLFNLSTLQAGCIAQRFFQVGNVLLNVTGVELGQEITGSNPVPDLHGYFIDLIGELGINRQ